MEKIDIYRTQLAQGGGGGFSLKGKGFSLGSLGWWNRISKSKLLIFICSSTIEICSRNVIFTWTSVKKPINFGLRFSENSPATFQQGEQLTFITLIICGKGVKPITHLIWSVPLAIGWRNTISNLTNYVFFFCCTGTPTILLIFYVLSFVWRRIFCHVRLFERLLNVLVLSDFKDGQHLFIYNFIYFFALNFFWKR